MLVAEHTDVLYRLAVAIVGEPDARDVAQESIVAAWVEIGSLRRADRFSAWLQRIVVNRCRNLLRNRRRRGVTLSLHRPEPESSNPEPIGERLIDHGSDFRGAIDARATLEPAFEALSADQRALLALHYSFGYSIREAAETLEIPVGTAKSRLNTALAVLRRAIEQERKS